VFLSNHTEGQTGLEAKVLESESASWYCYQDRKIIKQEYKEEMICGKMYEMKKVGISLTLGE
jgi:hypothetical protein